MRLLLDENVPIRFGPKLVGHDVTHVRDLGWLSIPDQDVATRSNGIFDAILTLDQAFPNEVVGLVAHPAIVVISPRSHRLSDVMELLPAILDSLKTIQIGEIVRLFRPPSVLI